MVSRVGPRWMCAPPLCFTVARLGLLVLGGFVLLFGHCPNTPRHWPQPLRPRILGHRCQWIAERGQNLRIGLLVSPIGARPLHQAGVSQLTQPKRLRCAPRSVAVPPTQSAGGQPSSNVDPSPARGPRRWAVGWRIPAPQLKRPSSHPDRGASGWKFFGGRACPRFPAGQPSAGRQRLACSIAAIPRAVRSTAARGPASGSGFAWRADGVCTNHGRGWGSRSGSSHGSKSAPGLAVQWSKLVADSSIHSCFVIHVRPWPGPPRPIHSIARWHKGHGRVAAASLPFRARLRPDLQPVSMPFPSLKATGGFRHSAEGQGAARPLKRAGGCRVKAACEHRKFRPQTSLPERPGDHLLLAVPGGEAHPRRPQPSQARGQRNLGLSPRAHRLLAKSWKS